MAIIIKIGGSNLRNSDSLVQVREVVSQYDQAVILVVSAFSGLTDSFYNFIEDPAISKPALNEFIKGLKDRYKPVFDNHFIDDNLRNVEAARQLNIKGIKFDDPGQLKQELKKFNIEVS